MHNKTYNFYSRRIQTNICPIFLCGHTGMRPRILEPPLLYLHPVRKSCVLPPLHLSLIPFYLLPIFSLILPALYGGQMAIAPLKKPLSATKMEGNNIKFGTAGASLQKDAQAHRPTPTTSGQRLRCQV